jgi:phenylacetaldehyde dehydrogenase
MANRVDAVAKFANDTEYGLQASVWTCNLKVTHMMARKIKAGTICIEMGKDVMEHYTETRSVAARP